MGRNDLKRMGNLAMSKCSYLGNEPEIPSYEIVKYYPNHYYGRKDDFEPVGGGMYKEKGSDGGWRVHEACFKYPESCFSVAIWRWDKHEEIYQLESVGKRLNELVGEERKLFWDLYDWGEKFLEEKEKELNEWDD